MFINNVTKELSVKIVYYGPGLSGKTTNLQYIYKNTDPSTRGEIITIETETDRTFFFDLLPLNVGKIAGYRVRIHLTTVPGQVFYNVLRKLVLKGVDGIVFVADSQKPLLDSNLESLDNLKENLKEYNIDFYSIPFVFQYNKRDLKNILTIEEMNQYLNPYGFPYIEASAIKGIGVFETLQEISKLTLKDVSRKILKPEEKVIEPKKVAVPIESDAFEKTQVYPQFSRKTDLEISSSKSGEEKDFILNKQVHVSKLESVDKELEKLEKKYLMEEIGRGKEIGNKEIPSIDLLKPVEIKKKWKKRIKLEDMKKFDNKLNLVIGDGKVLETLDLPSSLSKGQKIEVRIEIEIDIE
jgi:signal recognition particle receptor subunit beta